MLSTVKILEVLRKIDFTPKYLIVTESEERTRVTMKHCQIMYQRVYELSSTLLTQICDLEKYIR
jgi:hypothetical protein